MSVNRELLDFIKRSPTAFQAVATAEDALRQKGFNELRESDKWVLEKNGKYYTKKNGSSLIAFEIPEGDFSGFMMTAAHGDNPSFKIKENAEQKNDVYVRLSTESYGGGIYSTWLDRPLSVAGRIIVRDGNGFSTKLVDMEKPVAVIPNLCIHFNRDANTGLNLNPAVDMVPLLKDAGDGKSFREMIAEKAGVKEEDILSTDLFLYNPQEGIEWSDYISSPRLDDLQSAFALLKGFIKSKPSKAVKVYCLFDNEEVGSGTKQGAASTFLSDVLERIADCFGLTKEERIRKLACSFMVSCDNGHAVHPNHPEFSDPNHAPRMNKGVVIKYNASQRYTTDAVSAAMFRLVCEKANVPVQMFFNRADIRGGGTLGNISTTQVSVNTVDIGLAQLAMHSSFETAGAKDTEYLVKAITAFYGKQFIQTENGYTLE